MNYIRIIFYAIMMIKTSVICPSQSTEVPVKIFFYEDNYILGDTNAVESLAKVVDEGEFLYVERVYNPETGKLKKVRKIWKIIYKDSSYVNLSYAGKLKYPRVFQKMDIDGKIIAVALDSTSKTITKYNDERKERKGAIMAGALGAVVYISLKKDQALSKNRQLIPHIFKDSLNQEKVILATNPTKTLQPPKSHRIQSLILIGKNYLQEVFELEEEKTSTLKYEDVIQLIRNYNSQY